MTENRTLAIICPVHNEEDSIEYFFRRLSESIDLIASDHEVAVYFINNASTDQSLAKILALRDRDKRVQVITHSRNFGYQASVLCGVTHARGDALVIIDVDCEDPPEMIPGFVKHWEDGYDIVYGQRVARPEPVAMIVARRIFYRVTNLIADWDFIIDMAEFSLFSDRVRRQILRHRSTFPFVRSDLGYVGFNRIGIPYAREPRHFGRTHYNLFRMTKFAVGGILTASTFLLRMISYFGVPLAAINIISAVLQAFQISRPMIGLPELNAAFVTMALSVLSIYTARIVKDVVHRPVFIVDLQRSHLNHPIEVD
jgi:glycosyltransferase involved in cell wall biosynthesis